MTMDWTNNMVIDFLHAYETEPVIWDLRLEERKKKYLVAEAWRRVQKLLDWDCSIEDLKRKKDSLMAYYRMHLHKAKKRKTSEDGSEEEYKTSWFAYDTMNSFLGDIYDDINFTDESRTEKRNTRKRVEYLESDNDSYDIIEQPEPIRLEEVKAAGSYNERGYSAKERATHGDDNKTNEIELYGKLLCEKLMKLNEEDRLQLMNAIDNLVFRTTMDALVRDKAHRTPAPATSTQNTRESSKEYIIPMFKSSPKATATDDPLID